jgi:hypothetical protein
LLLLIQRVYDGKILFLVKKTFKKNVNNKTDS